MVGYPKEVAVASLLLLLLSLLLLLRWRQSLVIVIVCGHQDPEFVQPEKGEQSLWLALLLPSNHCPSLCGSRRFKLSGSPSSLTISPHDDKKMECSNK